MQSRLPQLDKILRDASLSAVLSKYKRELTVRVLREILAELRRDSRFLDTVEIAALAAERLESLSGPSLCKLINGTGVVLNTNLGRAPISAKHLSDLLAPASTYCNLEIDLETGKRGKRSSRLSRFLELLCGAEASIAVNNNAAALVLIVSCLAPAREVVVSRGELIEIGGSFRLPDIIEAAGGRLKEVGTTNKTRLADFEKAIGPETGLLMRCHRSNFELRGFTEETRISDLAQLCKAKGIPLVEDLGSGALMNLGQLGLEEEPTVEDSLKSGCDLVCFSGDKLLGGPQSGIICGGKELISRLHKHPLYRALRLDKVGIFLLERTLQSYFLSDSSKELPALALIAANQSDLLARVQNFAARAAAMLENIQLEAKETLSTTGGGSLPGKEKASAGLLLKSKWKPTQLAYALRKSNPAVISVSRDGDNLIDFRTVFPSDEELLLQVLLRLDSQIC